MEAAALDAVERQAKEADALALPLARRRCAQEVFSRTQREMDKPGTDRHHRLMEELGEKASDATSVYV